MSTSTTGFAGPTRKGPVGETPELLTSFADFEQIYGGLEDLSFGGGAKPPNYIAHAVRAYFAEGGSRLYVARVFNATSSTDTGVAHKTVIAGTNAADPPLAAFVAQSAGAAGNGTITVALAASPASSVTLARAPAGSTARISTGSGSSLSVQFSFKGKDGTWSSPDPTAPTTNATVELITVTVTTLEQGADPATAIAYQGLGLTPDHPQWIGTVLSATPTSRADHLSRMFALKIQPSVTPSALLAALVPSASSGGTSNSFTLVDGDDGQEPISSLYDTDGATTKCALNLLAGIEDISIIAAPGSSTFTQGQAIAASLIAYAEKPRAYRIAVLDTPKDRLVSDARNVRAQIDSSYAALYYPWVVVANPAPGGATEITLPPSGFLCGVYARSDDARGVFKAPANEVVQSALRFERDVNQAEQEVLNPLGVNCLRFFPGRGYRVWGARTASSDPEWKYVNVRRYFLYLEHSIDAGTQWAVFEPNGERLWANIRQTISSFLYNEWVSGALLGSDPTQAFFVRCDRTTMTQNDLDNGRLVCLIGVAVVKPAEFVIFRIGQMTADSRS